MRRKDRFFIDGDPNVWPGEVRKVLRRVMDDRGREVSVSSTNLSELAREVTEDEFNSTQLEFTGDAPATPATPTKTLAQRVAEIEERLQVLEG